MSLQRNKAVQINLHRLILYFFSSWIIEQMSDSRREIFK